MFPIDVSSATASLPTPATAGTPGFFTDGNAGDNIPATIVPADWLNAVQQEILNAIAAASISPDKTVQNQLLAAILVLAGKNALTYTVNPGTITAGSVFTSVQTFAGATMGDIVTCSFSLSLSSITLTGYVSAANQITLVFANVTGSSKTLSSGTAAVKLIRPIA